MNFTNFITTNNNYIAIIDGSLCTTKDECLNTIADALQFPEYFNDNLDSLDECLNDLEWIENKRIVCLFINFENFLKNDEHLKEPIMKMFADAKESLVEFEIMLNIAIG